VDVDVRVFGKPATRPYRRMGVALALGGASTDEARERARKAAERVKINYAGEDE
jgi:phosphoribosylglycinamide formyltransferase 2